MVCDVKNIFFKERDRKFQNQLPLSYQLRFPSQQYIALPSLFYLLLCHKRIEVNRRGRRKTQNHNQGKYQFFKCIFLFFIRPSMYKRKYLKTFYSARLFSTPFLLTSLMYFLMLLTSTLQEKY